MTNQRACYGAKDKHSLVQQNCVYTAIAFIVRKTGPICLVLVDLMVGWQAEKIGMSNKLFKILY